MNLYYFLLLRILTTYLFSTELMMGTYQTFIVNKATDNPGVVKLFINYRKTSLMNLKQLVNALLPLLYNIYT